ncbi:MAG: efflux transporter outer membrane subunit [Akkermansia sp.]|nr:efflux transporter outer membrane subunit [Akkermansia sp.]
MNKRALLSLAGVVVMTSACTLGPNWEKPQMEVPAVFRGAGMSGSNMSDLPWQAVMKDRNLQALLNDVFAHNRSLQALEHNVEAARQYVTMARAPMFPWVNYGASTSKGMNSAGGANITNTGGMTANPASTSLSATWEIDLWGKLRRGVESADASAAQAAEELNNLRISLMRQVACGYLQLIMLDEQLRITRNSVESYSDTLKLFNDQLKEGVVDRLQVSSAQGALASAQAEAPALELQIAALENTLCMLAGRAPGRIARSGSLKAYMNASRVAAGIPADVLSRRPDIRAKEQAMRAANADVGVAIASYFPSISLTGAVGFASSDLRHTVRGSSQGWGIGANLTGPLFQAGKLKANEIAKKEAFMAAKADYEQAVLNALAEVASTLVQRQKLREVISKQEAAVAAYEQTVSLAKQRYKEGYSAYFEVLDNQLRLFPAQKQLANYRYQYAACIPTLYTQLGGGWMENSSK